MASVVGPAVIGGMTEAAVGSYRIHAFQDDVEALNYVFQAEDVLHDCSWWYLCNDNSASSSSRSCNLVRRVYKIPQNTWHKWKISRRIRHVSKELRLFEEMAVQHGLSRQQAQHPPPIEESEERTASILFDEPFTVGLDAKMSEFLSLVEVHPRIGVVGMGSIGKNRLLQHVYKEKESRFERLIWLCISQIYDVKSLETDILLEIVNDNSKIENLSKLTKERRAQKIHEALKDKA